MAEIRRASTDNEMNDQLLIALLTALRRWPDQRVGQIIVNATGRSDPFYVEDDELIRALHVYGRKPKKEAESGGGSK